MPFAQKADGEQQLAGSVGVKLAMGASKKDENVMAAGAAHPRFLGVSIILGSLLWTGGIMGFAGSALGSDPDRRAIRFCNGKCICDGGVTDAALMSRVCPEGWENVYARARQARQRKYRQRLRDRVRKLPQAPPQPPTPPMVPNV